MNTAPTRTLIFVALLCSASTRADDRAARVGQQWVTTFSFLDNLSKATVRSPHLPASRPLFHRVDKAKKNGQTVQNPWPGDGPHRYMHVRVRKSVSRQVRQDLRDCLVVPAVGQVSFQVNVLPKSQLRFAPEYVRTGGLSRALMRVTISVGGNAETVLWEERRKGRSLWKNEWVETVVPLDAYAGKSATITFSADDPAQRPGRWKKRGKHGGVGLFALPRVLTSISAEDTAGRAAVKAVVGDELNHNVIMFVFDSMRADLMTPVREKFKRIPPITPRLDAFAEKGVRFTRAFSVGNQTRIGSYSMYLATPPAAGGFWQIRWTLSDKFRKDFYAWKPVSLPRTLHKAGYLTGHMGYNGFLTGNMYLSMDMGFDFVSEFNGPPKNTVRMTKAIIDWLDEHKDQKFFLLVWFDPPHFPYTAPEGYRKKLYSKGLNKKSRYFAHGYLAKMIYGDEYFGKIADKLTSLGLDRKTLMIVTADHGEAMDPRHDGYSNNVNTRVARHHGKSFYDEEVHVPLIFRMDGQLPKKLDVPEQVSLVSLAPTVQELLGLPTNLKNQFGRSFATLVRGKKEAAERTVYFEGRWSHGISRHGHKYIFHDKGERLKLTRKSLWRRSRDGTDEIFDTAKDPDELTNIATTKPEIRAKMRKAYFEHRARMRAFRKARSKERLTRPIAEIGDP